MLIPMQGKRYAYGAFRYHWRKLYAQASARYKIAFRLYDMRHLFVTSYIQRAKQEAAGDAVKLSELKEGLQLLMAWRSSHTMRAYDHSFREAEGLAQLAAMHQSIDQEILQTCNRLPEPKKPGQHPPLNTPHDLEEVVFVADDEDEDLLAWVQRH